MSGAMKQMPRASTAAFFDEAYQRAHDPWDFAGSAYEQGRYDATMAALAGRCYRRAFEPGCSVGVLTQRLAGICVRVDALDLSQTAVERARERCARLPQVQVTCEGFPPLPSELATYDLIVLSEIGYYFSSPELSELAVELIDGMSSGATLLAVHWTGASADHQISGDEVHTILGAQDGLALEVAKRYEGFRLDLWRRR